MKKIFLLAALAVSTLGASAQVYLGGSIGLGQTNANNVKTTVATIAPEVGYTFNNRWEAGLKIGYTSADVKNGSSVNTFNLNPYARYTAAHFGPVNLFVEGGVGLEKVSTNSDWGFNVGLRPGLAVNMAKNWTFITKAGFLGYADNGQGRDYVGFNADTENLTFGVLYNF